MINTAEACDGEDFEPVVEIAPEELIAHHLLKISIGRGHQADVNRDCCGSPSCSNDFSCVTPEQFYWRSGSECHPSPECPPMGLFLKRPIFCWRAPVNAPRSYPNNSLSRSPVGMAAAAQRE